MFPGIVVLFKLFLKATKALKIQERLLEDLITQLEVTRAMVEGWVVDVQAWAEGKSIEVKIIHRCYCNN